MAVYGYIRVSTKEQNEARKRAALEAYGVEEKNLHIDFQSGKDFERPQYKLLMRRLKCGDTVIIKSIDRLGRNYDEILEQWRRITREKQAAVVVLDMPLLNTEYDRDLTGRLIADIVLQLLSYVAQTEREFIRQRQRESIDAAKNRGVAFGAPLKARPQNYENCLSEWKNGSISARQATKRMQVSHKTFLRWARRDLYISLKQEK